MKYQTISKTFRLLPDTIKIITEYAQEQQMNISQALREMITTFHKEKERKQFKRELLELSQDKDFLKECEEWDKINLN